MNDYAMLDRYSVRSDTMMLLEGPLARWFVGM